MAARTCAVAISPLPPQSTTSPAARNNGSVARSSALMKGPIRRRCTSHRDPGSHHLWHLWSLRATKLRIPKLYNLRSDPFERGPESIEYAGWFTHRAFVLVPAQVVVRYLESFKEFPPRAKAASFTVSDAMEKIQAVGQEQN
jgi:hypothetical protein